MIIQPGMLFWLWMKKAVISILSYGIVVVPPIAAVQIISLLIVSLQVMPSPSYAASCSTTIRFSSAQFIAGRNNSRSPKLAGQYGQTNRHRYPCISAFISTLSSSRSGKRASYYALQTTNVSSRHTTTLLYNSKTPESNNNKMTQTKELIPPQQSTTIYDILHSSIQLLHEKSIPEPEESVLHLLSHTLHLDWESGYGQLRQVLKFSPLSFTASSSSSSSNNLPILSLAQQTLTPDQRTIYQSLLERRMQFEPIQYIIGKWDFHYLTGLTIRKPMLCPRPETEELVELVLSDIDKLLRKRQQYTKVGEEDRRIRILDVGCGTGAIGIAIAHQYPTQVQVVALDVLPDAVELSNENANKLLPSLIEADDKKSCNDNAKKSGGGSVYQAILCSANEFTNRNKSDESEMAQKYNMNYDIVVSNPPYIPKVDMQDLSTDVVGYESYNALCGGDDGLNVVRDIVQRLPEWMSRGTNKEEHEEVRHCWIEVDDSHPQIMEQWLAPGSEESVRLGVEYCNSYKDFCGRDRFVKLKVSGVT